MSDPARPFQLDDFDFALPPELIAQHPAAQRSASRLLDGRRLPGADHVFSELPQLLEPGDLLVFNNTRVIKARLLGHKDSGGAVEVLVERLLPGTGNEVLAHVRASKPPRAGARLWLGDDAGAGAGAGSGSGSGSGSGGGAGAGAGGIGDAGAGFEAEVLGRGGADGSLFHLRFAGDPLPLLDRHGHVPLPPYITHADDADDERRYQTVFASRPGAVAAPTAALHFDAALLGALQQRSIGSTEITLHVGAGTFLPVRSSSLAEHRMHSEWFEVPAVAVDAIARTRAAGGRIVAVGTTTLRALESAALGGELQAGARETDIFITPGFGFRVVDRLVTNFHLPKSTLMMLVSAFAGHAHVMALYAEAIQRRYRFFSYGDAMLLERLRGE